MDLNIYQHRNNFSKLENIDCKLVYGYPQNLSEPLVSIIITVYKRKKYVIKAIYSAIRQEGIQFEYEIIIISDDPDDILKEANNFTGIKNIYFYKNSQNIGLYNSCNMGATIARGEYLAFLHDDDLLYSNYLFEIDKFVKFIKPDAGCILINRDVIKNTKRKKSFRIIILILGIIFFLPCLIRYFSRKPYKSISLKEGLVYQLSNIYKAPSCGTLFKKNTFIESGGFNQDFWPISDYFFFLGFNQRHKIFMIKKKLACYRWLDNLSQNKDIQLLGLKLFDVFFKSIQPIKSINKYFNLFHNEVLYAKYLMVDESFRAEIKHQYPELIRLNKIKWIIFKVYNMSFRFFHDIV
jgi:glycosyltransferase involved in cell wall biosynthesis